MGDTNPQVSRAAELLLHYGGESVQVALPSASAGQVPVSFNEVEVYPLGCCILTESSRVPPSTAPKSAPVSLVA